MANPVTHLEKTIAGEVSPVTHLEKVIAEYGGGNVYENLEAGTNILIEETADGKAKISASGEVSSEDTVARADIAAIKDGTNIDSFGDVETALATKANTATTYTKTEVDTALGSKQDTISDLSTIRSGAALGATAVQPETGKGLSTNDYTNTEKSKLAGIEAQANKTTVDDALSGSSTNPVQNKVVKSALDGKANASTTYTKTEVDTALSGKQATLTSAQLEAANSGITSADVAQITTNKNNILACKEFTDNASIDSDRKLYISATEPTNPPLNSTWISGKIIKSADSNSLNLAPDLSSWSYGYFSSNGSYDNSHPNGEKTTNDYITVTGGEQYTYSCVDGFPTTTWCSINTFDSSYNFIARLAYTDSRGTTVTLGNNVAYIKLSFRTFDINNLIPVFNQGSTAVAYYVWQ